MPTPKGFIAAQAIENEQPADRFAVPLVIGAYLTSAALLGLWFGVTWFLAARTVHALDKLIP